MLLDRKVFQVLLLQWEELVQLAQPVVQVQMEQQVLLDYKDLKDYQAIQVLLVQVQLVLLA